MMDFSTLIQKWFRQNQRKLPWRETKDPYLIWLSEIILQQTRVDQGLSYYLKFKDHYPTVQHLAKAPEDEVLNDWQGLSYYSRARNLHAAAKYLVDELDGQFPKTYEGVLKLKGVGEYTAAAISSIAYGLPHAVVDGNVYRVLSRFLDLNTPIDSTQGKKEFKLAAHELLDPKNPSDHNQGVMELGALVCTPKQPNCENCPVKDQCLGFANGTHLELPVKTKKVKVRNRYFHYFILQKGDELLIRKRGGGDIWEGLYDFPLLEIQQDREPNKVDLKSFGVSEIEQMGQMKHILTHQRILANFWKASVDEFPKIENGVVISQKELPDFPMPQLLIRYMESTDVFS